MSETDGAKWPLTQPQTSLGQEKLFHQFHGVRALDSQCRQRGSTGGRKLDNTIFLLAMHRLESQQELLNASLSGALNRLRLNHGNPGENQIGFIADLRPQGLHHGGSATPRQ